MGKPHHSSLLIGDHNGRLAKTDPGSGPVILDNICSQVRISFLSTATKGTSLHPVRTFWRGKRRRTCPDHARLHRNSEDLLQPSGAYVLEELTELSDGHHILGVCFQVVDGPIPLSMKVPKAHHQYKRQVIVQNF